MRNLLLRFLFCLALPGTLPRASSAQVPVAALTARVDSLFAPWGQAATPGLVLGVIHRGRLVLERAYGMADVGRREPLTPGHAFWVASVAKQFTAAAIALLVEEGKITLADDIRTYLPELPFPRQPARVFPAAHPPGQRKPPATTGPGGELPVAGGKTVQPSTTAAVKEEAHFASGNGIFGLSFDASFSSWTNAGLAQPRAF